MASALSERIRIGLTVSDGPVASGLLGAPAEGLELAARLHVLAIDPCVEFDFDIAEA